MEYESCTSYCKTLSGKLNFKIVGTIHIKIATKNLIRAYHTLIIINLPFMSSDLI